MGHTRRTCTREFKQETVKLVTAGGHPTAQTARDLGITPNLLRRWTQEVAGDPVAAFPGKGRRNPHEEERARRARELARVTQELATAALTMAVEHRGPAHGVVHHTDRGSQYAATTYRELLAEHGLTARMSRRVDCGDNAVVESVFHTLNTEHVHHQRDRTREEARQDMFEMVEVFYNRVRRHSTLGSRSPAEFEAMATDSYPGVHEIEGGSGCPMNAN